MNHARTLKNLSGLSYVELAKAINQLGVDVSSSALTMRANRDGKGFTNKEMQMIRVALTEDKGVEKFSRALNDAIKMCQLFTNTEAGDDIELDDIEDDYLDLESNELSLDDEDEDDLDLDLDDSEDDLDLDEALELTEDLELENDLDIDDLSLDDNTDDEFDIEDDEFDIDALNDVEVDDTTGAVVDPEADILDLDDDEDDWDDFG